MIFRRKKLLEESNTLYEDQFLSVYFKLRCASLITPPTPQFQLSYDGIPGNKVGAAEAAKAESQVSFLCSFCVDILGYSG